MHSLRVESAPPTFLAPDAIPATPTPQEVGAATSLLLNDLLVDFPFRTPTDRAHMVAALLLPLVRASIDGCVPLHVFDATGPGAGKTLLVQLIGLIATGETTPSQTLSRREREVRLAITANLRSDRPVVLFDHMPERYEVSSSALAAALASKRVTARLRGATKPVELANAVMWCMTGNHIRLSNDLTKRSVWIRLAPQANRPWLRQGFKHDLLLNWAADHRADLVRALLTLRQAWLAAGSPLGSRALASCEEWSRTIGGILQIAQIDGFLGDPPQPKSRGMLS